MSRSLLNSYVVEMYQVAEPSICQQDDWFETVASPVRSGDREQMFFKSKHSICRRKIKLPVVSDLSVLDTVWATTKAPPLWLLNLFINCSCGQPPVKYICGSLISDRSTTTKWNYYGSADLYLFRFSLFLYWLVCVHSRRMSHLPFCVFISSKMIFVDSSSA